LTNRRRGTCRERRDHAGRGGNDRRVYETFVRTAGTAREMVARGNLRQILTAGDDVEAVDDCDR
jgi:hypothetical protein